MTVIREHGPSLSYEVDTIGFFNAQLRDLRGFLTLAQELIQNADDAKASKIIFDARDEALIAENDSLFSDCGQVAESTCAFGDAANCDFHRFRRVASGGKRLQDDTTGAFGIGFISVFQVTDCPEVESGTWSWRVDLAAPPHQRIKTSRLSPAAPGTVIRLPWAREQSWARAKLAVEPVATNAADGFVDDVRKGLSRALLFLRHLNAIEIRRNGGPVSRMERTPSRSGGDVVVEEHTASKAPKKTRWHVLTADFRAEAERLRAASNGRIEPKRRSLVQIAFSAQVELTEGRFYASLPTEHTIPIPLYINADFFPTNDRKRILLDHDYQGQWNRAAITSAASLVANSVGALCEALPMERFWGLLEGLWQCRQLSIDPDIVLRTFWDRAQPAATSLPIVLTTTGKKAPARDVRLLQSVKEEREALSVLTQDLTLPIVTPDLNKHRNLLLALGVPELNVRHVVEAMGVHGLLGEPIPASAASKFGQESSTRAVLARQLFRLQKRAQVAGGGDARVTSTCRICLTTDGQLAPSVRTRNASKRERTLFGAGPLKFLGEQNDPVVRDFVSGFSLEDALSCLAGMNTGTLWDDWQKNGSWWTELLDWLDSRRPELQAAKTVTQRFAAQAIWPSSSGLHVLSELSMPGSFSNPLKLASLVHVRLAKYRDLLINVLGVTPLSIVSYAIQHVPKAFAKDDAPSPELVRELVRVLAQNNGPLRESQAAKNALSSCPLIECEDGAFYSAPQTYFRNSLVSSLLGDDAHYVSPTALASHAAARELFVWLGVAEKPGSRDIVSRVKELAAGSLTPEAKASLTTLLAALGPAWSDYASDPAMAELRDLSWLPAKASTEWKQPGELAASFRDYLFETQATFIDLPLPVQQTCAKMFEFLGVQANPTVAQVVNHLLTCASGQRRMHSEVYRFLNDSVEELPLDRLRGKPCILLSDGNWEFPGRLFWNDHGLHPLLHVLDPRWRDYSRFLATVGVRESPGPEDAIRVMLDIAKDDKRTSIGQSAASIARSCWTLLNGFLEREEMRPGLLAVLGPEPTVPLPDGTFGRPNALLLDDRPWISKLFGEKLSACLLPRQEGFWLALQTAGLRPLSLVIVEESTDLETSGPDETLRARLLERTLPLARVFSSALDSDAGEVLNRLSTISVIRASSLAVIHRLPTFEPAIAGHREEPDAWLEPECEVLYVRTIASDPWTAIARQIALRLAPTTNISQVTPALRDVLAADSPDSAQALLDELGFTSLQIPVPVEQRGTYDLAKPPEDEMPSENLDTATSSPVSSPPGSVSGTGPSPESAAPPSGGESPQLGPGSGQNAGQPPSSPSPQLGATAAGTPSPTGLVQPSGKPSAQKPAELQVHARSYVVHKSSTPRESSDEPGWIEVANAGVKYARAYEYNNQRQPRSMPHNHPGWDIESKGDDATEVERYIEVKATRGAWSGYGVGLTDTEYEKAREFGDRYWLYIVEHALGVPRLYAFQNPAARVSEYRVDDGWRQFADETDANRPRSILDLPREQT